MLRLSLASLLHRRQRFFDERKVGSCRHPFKVGGHHDLSPRVRHCASAIAAVLLESLEATQPQSRASTTQLVCRIYDQERLQGSTLQGQCEKKKVHELEHDLLSWSDDESSPRHRPTSKVIDHRSWRLPAPGRGSPRRAALAWRSSWRHFTYPRARAEDSRGVTTRVGAALPACGPQVM